MKCGNVEMARYGGGVSRIQNFFTTTTKNITNTSFVYSSTTTSQIMPCWDISPFQAFNNTIEEALVDPLVVDITTLSLLQEIFDTVSTDLSGVLDTPTKSLKNRDEMRSGKLYTSVYFVGYDTNFSIN